MTRVSKEYLGYFYDHGIDISSKTLYMGYGDLDDVELDAKLAADMIKGLHILERIRPEDPIHILINCQGGDVDHGLAIYDKIRNIRNTHVIATVTGTAWSMAAWVLQAADERRITKNSSLMIHDGAGPKDRFTREQDVLCRKILLERIREKHPTFPVSKLQKMLDTDTYFSATEAQDIGLIDEVIGE